MPLTNSTPTYGAPSTYTIGFTCDGYTPYRGAIRCTQRISLASFYATQLRHGWTLTRDGKAYCAACTPRYNHPHTCPQPEPHTCPKPPAPPRLTEDNSLGLAPMAVVTYWHKDERRARRWRVTWKNLYFRAEGVSILKFPADGSVPKVHDIEWGYIISVTTEARR